MDLETPQFNDHSRISGDSGSLYGGSNGISPSKDPESLKKY